MILKKTATDDATLRDHMTDDVENLIDRFVISKYRCSHAYCLIKLELLHFASLWFITFYVKSFLYILGY